MSNEAVDWQRLQRFFVFCGAVGACVLVVGVVYYALILPFLLSAVLTYLLNPLVKQVERLQVRRTGAALLVLVAGLVGVSLVASWIVPVLYRELANVLRAFPDAATTLMQTWLPSIEQSLGDMGVDAHGKVMAYIKELKFLRQIEAPVGAGIFGLWKTGASVLGGVLNVVLVPFLTFFLLIEQDRIRSRLMKLVPVDLVEPVQCFGNKIDDALRSVLVGLATVAGILAALYAIGFSLIGLQSAVAIGVVAGICRVVPYFDVVVGAALCLIVLLSDFPGWGMFLAVVLVFVVVQSIDGMLVTPKVIGHRIGLHPVLVILSIFAFAYWFGFWGVLFVIPTIAVVKVIIETAIPFYRASRAYDPSGASLREASTAADSSSIQK